MDEEKFVKNTETITTTTTTPVEEEKAGMSVASLILGIVSLVLFCFWKLSLPCAIVAIILGAIGRKKGGKGMGTAGIVLGAIALLIDIIIVILVIVGVGALAGNPEFLEVLNSISY